MPRLVPHPLTSEPVLVSPERGERPGAWGADSQDAASGEPPCPFCPGHEEETPPELARHAGNATWSARVVPNKYPAIAPIGGVPSHEVLIDTDSHDSPLESRNLAGLVDMLQLWRERFVRHAERPEIESVVLFRNEGRGAGQSIEHPHSQLVALPFVPPRLQEELRTFASAGTCPLCSMTAAGDTGALVVARLGGITVLCPDAPRLPYETWLVPERHEPEWPDGDVTSLATALRAATRALRRRWPLAPYNIAVSSAPRHTPERASFHWHLELLPRLTNVAGFELATGSWMNIVDPSRATEELRASLQE